MKKLNKIIAVVLTLVLLSNNLSFAQVKTAEPMLKPYVTRTNQILLQRSFREDM